MAVRAYVLKHAFGRDSTDALVQVYHNPPPHDSDEEEAEHSLLHQNPTGPFHGPFDEPHSHMGTPDAHEPEGYELTESYVGADDHNAPYNGYTEYKGTNLTDSAYGMPDRVPSPYSGRSDTGSTEAWAQRQQPGGGVVPTGNLKRAGTRKVKLVQGSVLSADYPVPSAIQNAVQAKYRNDLESGSEEFTHVRCRLGVVHA